MRTTLTPAALALAFTALAPAQAQTVIDHANGYTLTAAGALQRFTSLAFDAQGKVVVAGVRVVRIVFSIRNQGASVAKFAGRQDGYNGGFAEITTTQ